MSAENVCPRRRFGRCEAEAPVLVWRLRPGDVIDAGLLDAAASRGADLVLLDAGATPPASSSCRWLVGASVAEAQDRSPTRLLRLLDQLGTSVLGLVLQGATPGQVKAGRAVDRIARLRADRGLPLWCIEAPDDALDTEWLIENTPAHGILLGYHRRNQSAGFRALTAASELGVAAIAIPGFDNDPRTLIDEVRFLVSDHRVTCVSVPVPGRVEQADQLIRAARSPISERERGELWHAYRTTNPEPKRPRHGHVIDE